VWRVVCAGLGVGLYWAAQRALWAHDATEFQLRPDREWRVLIEGGGIAVGDFPAVTTAEAEVRQFYETIDTQQLPNLSPTLRERLKLCKRLELACAGVRTRGVDVVPQNPGVIVVVAGWIFAAGALPFVVPVLRGFFSLWMRRRRLVRELCQTCAYPLAGLPEPRCPECGEKVAVRREL